MLDEDRLEEIREQTRQDELDDLLMLNTEPEDFGGLVSEVEDED